MNASDRSTKISSELFRKLTDPNRSFMWRSRQIDAILLNPTPDDIEHDEYARNEYWFYRYRTRNR